jgi:anti-sigma factor RsiW
MSLPHNHEHYEHLLVKAVDDALSAEERAELDAHLRTCHACASELKDFQLIKETTDAMTSRIMHDARIEPPRTTGAAKIWIQASLLLLLLGALMLTGFAGYALFADAAVPVVVKIGSAVAAMGGLGLLTYVLRLRARAAGKDPYEEIDQ